MVCYLNFLNKYRRLVACAAAMVTKLKLFGRSHVNNVIAVLNKILINKGTKEGAGFDSWPALAWRGCLVIEEPSLSFSSISRCQTCFAQSCTVRHTFYKKNKPRRKEPILCPSFLSHFLFCHHPVWYFIFRAHVTSLTCKENMQSNNSIHLYLQFTSQQGQWYIGRIFIGENFLTGAEFWTCNLPAQIFFAYQRLPPSRIRRFYRFRKMGILLKLTIGS